MSTINVKAFFRFCKVKLFLDSYWRQMGSKASSILDHYLKNVKKVVPQNMHFILAT